MLVRSTYADRGSIGFNMTPMIDIVFLLIIFFILSSHFARQETQLELALPEAASGQEAAVDETRRLIVSVLPDGQLQLAGAPVDAAELEQKISYESQREGGELEVRIRSDRQAPYRQVEPILVACARAGVWKVTFAVMPIGP
jgi:biopolymer transport protein ExbD